MKKLTLPRSRKLVEEVVRDFPDATLSALGWDRCAYQVKGRPSCIIGNVLIRHDPDWLPILRAWDTAGADGGSTSLRYQPARDSAAQFMSAAALQYLAAVQARQDIGHKWSECDEEA